MGIKRDPKYLVSVYTGLTYNLVNWIDGLCIAKAGNCSFTISTDLFRPVPLSKEEAYSLLDKLAGSGWELTNHFEYVKQLKERSLIKMGGEEDMKKEYIIADKDIKTFVKKDSSGKYEVTDSIEEAYRMNAEEALTVISNIIGVARIGKAGWRRLRIDDTGSGEMSEEYSSKQMDSVDELDGEKYAGSIDEYIGDDEDEYTFDLEELENFFTADDPEFDELDEDFLSGVNAEDLDFRFDPDKRSQEDMFFNNCINYRDYEEFKKLSLYFIEDFMRNVYRNLIKYVIETTDQIDKNTRRVENINQRLQFDDGDEQLTENYYRQLFLHRTSIAQDQLRVRKIKAILGAEMEDFLTGSVLEKLEYMDEHPTEK